MNTFSSTIPITSGAVGSTVTFADSSATSISPMATWGPQGAPDLFVDGNTSINGNLTVKGKDIAGLLEKIEERLAILSPNPELEERWSELKQLRNRYQELEKELLEKEKMWNILKK